MKLPKNWSQPKPPTETEVLAFLKMGFEAAQLIGMPIAICAIKPSDEARVLHTMVRASREHPGVPSAEDAAYLASGVLFDCTRGFPAEARPLLRGVILEHADELIYEHQGGPIPPHMIQSDYPPSVMGEEADGA